MGAETDYHLLCSRGPEGRGRRTLGVAPGAAVVKAAGRRQQPNLRRTVNTNHSGMRLRVTPSGHEPQPAEVLAKGRGCAGWVMEEDC